MPLFHNLQLIPTRRRAITGSDGYFVIIVFVHNCTTTSYIVQSSIIIMVIMMMIMMIMTMRVVAQCIRENDCNPLRSNDDNDESCQQ